MSHQNPIIRLAMEAEKRRWTDEQTERALGELGGLTSQHVHQAVEMARHSQFVGGVVVRVAEALAALLYGGGEVEVLGQVWLALGTGLVERPGSGDLRASLKLLEGARRWLRTGSPDFGRALINEANARTSLADMGEEASVNLAKAVELYALAKACFQPGSPDLGRALMNEANARARLADLGEDARVNLAKAVVLCALARACFQPGSPSFGRALMNEANARARLADMGEEASVNLAKAVDLNADAKACFQPGSPDLGRALINKANARARLADMGEEASVNLAKAVDLYSYARACFQPGSPDLGRALMSEANARASLANLGEDARVNLAKAVDLYARARDCFQPSPPDFGRALVNEANARNSLADLGEDAPVNLTKAVELCADAKACFQPGSPDFGNALMNEANARQSLADLGEDARVNLAKAVELYALAKACFQPGSPSFGSALMNAANARASLAGLGEDARVNLAKAVELYAEARACFQPGSPDFGRALMYEANARQGLANLGDDARVNLAKALELYAEARACFQPGSPDFGRALMSEANARQSLADLGDDPRVNLQRAADLYGEATACFGLETLDRGTCVRNHAHCLRALARHEPKLAIQHLRSAHRLLREGLGIIEKVRAQMHSEAARIAFLDTMAGQFQTMVLLCLDLAKAFEAKNEEQADAFKATNEEQADAFRAEAWQWVLRSKSRMLLELLSGVRPRLRPEDRPLWDRFQAANRELDLCEASLRQQKLNLGFRGEGLPEPQRNDYRIRLERYDNTRKAVMDQVASYRQLQSVEVPEPKSLVSQLRAKARNGGQGVLLVEYYHAGSEGQILVFLKPLWLDGPPVVVSIETETKVLIETLNGLLRGLALRGMTVRRREGEPEVKNRSRKKAEDSRSIELEDWHAAGKQIEQSMQAMAGWVSPWVEEVERRGWDVQHVVISPHGLLSHVPLHAVPVEGQLLIERWLVSYAPSSAMALQLKAGVQKPGGAALVMGNPQTDNPQDDLPGAEEEAWEVAQVLRQVGVKAQPFVRKDATRGKYVAEGPGKSLAHTACHTVLNPQFERTGLLMADGVLNAAEIVQQVDLKGVLLAYLSSCDSSRAELKRSEELMALVRVMMVAGAGTVMGTLWPLQDQAGKVFAKIFYEEWLVRGRTMPEAYKEAVLRTRAEDRRRDERGCYALGGLYELGAYAWAPFVLMGW